MDKIAKWFLSNGSMNYLALCSYLAVGFAVFNAFFLIFAHRWTTKPLAILLTILSGSATYFISKYNIAIDRTMLMHVLKTDSTESVALLSSQMLPYFFFLIALPIFIILRTEISYKKALPHIFTSSIALAASLIFAVGLCYLNFRAISQAVNISNKYAVHSLVPINVIRSGFSVVIQDLKPHFRKSRRVMDFSAATHSQKDLVVVLAIGETARQKSMSLYGYDRQMTTPLLSQVSDLHVLNGVATAGSTLYALPKILKKNDINLAAVTSKAGIETFCYVNFTLYGNCDPVKEVAVKDCGHGGDCYDEDVIPLLETNLEGYSSGQRFVVLHLGGGSHGPLYRDRYPPEFNTFQPICNDADVINQCSQEELLNSYDNSILYLDYVLSSIIEKLEASEAPYVLIYLSDHGESLLEDGLIFHGMPPGIPLPPEQAEIPLLVKSSIPIEVLERKEYAQPDVYDTVLSLFSIESDHFKENQGFLEDRR